MNIVILGAAGDVGRRAISGRGSRWDIEDASPKLPACAIHRSGQWSWGTMPVKDFLISICRVFLMASIFLAASGAHVVGRDWTSAGIIAAIEGSGLAEEINAVIGLEGAPEGYGPGPDPRIEIHFAGVETLFGYDGAGGSYHLLSDGRILLIDSEGQAGVIGSDFGTFIAIATSLPDWRSALGVMGMETLEAARTAWAALLVQWNVEARQDAPWPYMPELFTAPTPREARKAIAEHFGVSPPADPFAVLFEAVNALNDDVRVSWQGEFDYPLFGREFSLD